MNILVTVPNGAIRDTFIPHEVKEKIEELGTVEWNTSPKQFTTEELSQKVKGKDVCITGWGTTRFSKEVLENADNLKLIAHTGGSVAPIVSEELYQKGIKVISGNRLYAESVAEGVIAYILASLRDIPFYDGKMHEGCWEKSYNEGLLDQTVGLIGFGMISKYVIDMLKVFRCKIKVYSRYITEEDMKKYGVEKASVEEIFSTCKIISIHSGLTEKTRHMINKELLEMIPDGTLLVNTARGAIIDEQALTEELSKKRFKAALDVYEVEPLSADSKLRQLDNVLLMPHMAGPTVDRRKFVTLNLIDDIKSFVSGKPLNHEIEESYARNMTQ